MPRPPARGIPYKFHPRSEERGDILARVVNLSTRHRPPANLSLPSHMPDYDAWISGRRRGLVAGVLRGALFVASGLYQIAIRYRNLRFDQGHNVHQASVPVVSVGNLTTGGTGKTPLICYLARWFRSHDVRVAILSRGYGRGTADANDEAIELHERLPDVPHVQDPDRVASAQMAVEEFETQVILLDDGFQHRRLARDLEIVVIDATRPFGYGYLLPRGLLREPKSSLRRSDLIVLSRCGLVTVMEIDRIIEEVRRYHPTARIVQADHRPTALLEYPAKQIPLANLHGRRVLALSAIGNPQAFEASLERCQATLVYRRRLADHDSYSPEVVTELIQWVRSLGDSIDWVVCTHKDLVKLGTDRLGGRPLCALQIEMTILDGEAEIEQALMSVLNQVT